MTLRFARPAACGRRSSETPSLPRRRCDWPGVAFPVRHNPEAAGGNQSDRGPSTGQWFATTHWSVVLAAREFDSPDRISALEKLCRTYWRPLYVYARRKGHGPEQAQDLTQEFFARLLER
jgi:hypothetical protein